MLGSGMLSLPWVFAQLGLGGGLTIMLLVPLVGDRTIAFVTAAADRASARQRLRPPPAADKASTQQTQDIQGLFEVSERGAAPNFPEIVEASLGRGPALLAAVSLILLSFAVLVSYVVVVKALLPSQLEWLMHAAGVPPSVPPPSAGWALACVAAVALVPLSSLPSMEQVKYASVASVVLVYGFVLCVCAAGALELHDSPAAYDAFAGADAEWWRGGLADWLRCFPVVCFSFLCHMNVPVMYAEMRRQKYATSPSRWSSKVGKFGGAAHAAMVLATILYLLAALGGYAAFGVDCAADVLDNLLPGPDQPLPDGVTMALRAAFVGTMIATYPTISYGLRTSLHALAFKDAPESAPYRWSEATALVGLTVAVAVAVDDLGLVFRLAGSTCANVVMLLIPAMLHLRRPAGRPDAPRPLTERLDDIMASATLGAGVAVLFFVVLSQVFPEGLS